MGSMYDVRDVNQQVPEVGVMMLVGLVHVGITGFVVSGCK